MLPGNQTILEILHTGKIRFYEIEIEEARLHQHEEQTVVIVASFETGEGWDCLSLKIVGHSW